MSPSGALQLANGLKLTYTEDDSLQKQKNGFKIYDEGILRISPINYIVPTCFLKVAYELSNFKFQPTDVIVMSYPKCGSTWVQEIIWTMLWNPDLSHNLADTSALLRCPYFDHDGIKEFRKAVKIGGDDIPSEILAIFPDYANESHTYLDLLDATKPPRVMKTHLTPSVLDSSLLNTAKVVYTIRNPKDILLSFYHMMRLFKMFDFKGTLEEFGEIFIGDGIFYAPYAEHVRQFLMLREHKNIKLFYYEDLKKDVYGGIKSLQDFLGTNLSEEQIQNIIWHTQINQMRERNDEKENAVSRAYNKEVFDKEGGFFRRDKDKNKNYVFSKEFELKFQKWAETNLSDLNLPYKF